MPYFFLTSFYLIVSQSEVFAVAFALLAAGAVILTLNVLLLVIASFSLFIQSYFERQTVCVMLKGGVPNHSQQYTLMNEGKYLTVFISSKFQGGHIIFFQSLSLLGYCLFPLDVGALICMLKDNVIVKVVVVCVTLAWSSWAAYPFMSSAVNPRRKALALYPVFLMYVSVGFLIIAID